MTLLSDGLVMPTSVAIRGDSVYIQLRDLLWGGAIGDSNPDAVACQAGAAAPSPSSDDCFRDRDAVLCVPPVASLSGRLSAFLSTPGNAIVTRASAAYTWTRRATDQCHGAPGPRRV